MKIIADPETAGIETMALIINWGLSDLCQVDKCEEKAYAILSFTAKETPRKKPLNVVICKKHYEEGQAKKTLKWKFVLAGDNK